MKKITHYTVDFPFYLGKAFFTKVACLLLFAALQQPLAAQYVACLNGTTELYWQTPGADPYNCQYQVGGGYEGASITVSPPSLAFTYTDYGAYGFILVTPSQVGTFTFTISAQTCGFDGYYGNPTYDCCTDYAYFTVEVYEDTVNAVITDASCPGQANGAIDLTVTGPYNNPSYPFTYSWSGGQATSDISNIAGGQYNVTITDANYCLINKSYQVGGGIVGLSTANSTICTGGTAQLSVVNSGLGNTYTWQESSNNGSTWTNITGYINTSATSYISPPLTASKQYRVISVNPTCGTATSAAITITVVPDPILTLTATNATICTGASVGLSASVSGGIGTFSYQWQQKVNNVWTNVSSNYFYPYSFNSSPSITTTYRVQISQTGVGCNPIGIDTITITVLPSPNITVTPSPANGTIFCAGGSVNFTATGANTYTWTPATGLNTTSAATVTASPITNQTYTVTGTSANGCTASGQVPVTVYYYVNPYIIQSATQVCYGTPITYSIYDASCYTSFPSPTFQWKVNGIAIAGATNATFTSSNIHDNDAISLEINTGQSCHPLLTSANTIIADVVETGAMIVPTISISASYFGNSPMNVFFGCGNTSGTANLHASTTFGGSSPAYQWKKNGINIGTGSAISPVASVGDIFTCELTSSLACAVKPVTSNSIGVIASYPYSGFLNGSFYCETKEACIGDPVTYVVGGVQNCDPTNCPSNDYYGSSDILAQNDEKCIICLNAGF